MNTEFNIKGHSGCDIKIKKNRVIKMIEKMNKVEGNHEWNGRTTEQEYSEAEISFEGV